MYDCSDDNDDNIILILIIATTVTSTNTGYTRIGEEMLDQSNQVTGDTKEGYYVGMCMCMCVCV